MHIVIVDNGRSDILACTEHVNMLKCIRCGSCINTCPVYRRTGGYSYSYFIPGPVGINLGMLKSPEKYSGNVSACSLCYSCSNVCPVKIDLAEQIYKWRQNLAPLHLADPSKKLMVKGMKFIMNHPGLFYNAIAAGRVAERMPRFVLYNSLDAWGIGRELPEFAKETFNEMWKKGLKAD
jgi:L-lactate dehydrogenase complex protein LldF